MIEYLYNAIRATAGNDISVGVKVTSESGAVITDHCHLTLSTEDGSEVFTANGSLIENVWQFTIPAVATVGLKGRYWYCVCTSDTDLCFKQPIYLV